MKTYEEMLIQAHQEACYRESVSNIVLQNSFYANGRNAEAAITAAIQTFGGKHAPIEDTILFLKKVLANNEKLDKHSYLLGFGSSFYKGEPDPNLHELHEHVMSDRFLSIFTKRTVYDFRLIHKLVSYSRGLGLYPNLAFYTAIYFIVHRPDIRPNVASAYIIQYRLPAWLQILQQIQQEHPGNYAT